MNKVVLIVTEGYQYATYKVFSDNEGLKNSVLTTLGAKFNAYVEGFRDIKMLSSISRFTWVMSLVDLLSNPAKRDKMIVKGNIADNIYVSYELLDNGYNLVITLEMDDTQLQNLSKFGDFGFGLKRTIDKEGLLVGDQVSYLTDREYIVASFDWDAMGEATVKIVTPKFNTNGSASFETMVVPFEDLNLIEEVEKRIIIE